MTEPTHKNRELSRGDRWSLLLFAAVGAVTAAWSVVAIVVCLVLLIRNVMKGRVFGRTSARLVTTAGMVAVIGYAAYPFFGNMAANGAFATLSDNSFNNVVMSVNLGGLVAIAFVAALASTVFVVGERLQRDTEGLV